MTAISDYQALRSTVGVHTPDAPLVRITGDDRLEFLDSFLSRSAEYVDPDTTRECLALDANGNPFAILLHLERDEESWLLPRTPVTESDVRAYFDDLTITGDVTVEIAPPSWSTVAFEGPLAWQVAAQFVDFDIAGLVLHGITDIALPGADDTDQAWLARVGTTGEYGYLLISTNHAVADLDVLGRAEQVGGCRVSADGLARVQAEAGMPYYAMGVRHFELVEADLAWMVDWERLGDFHGSEQLEAPTTEVARRITPLVSDPGSHISVGDPVTAAGEPVGTIVYTTATANPDEQLVFALMETPFWAPSLPLAVAEQPASSISLPRVVAQSSLHKIG